MKKERQVCSLEQGKKLNELLRTGEDVVPATWYHFNGEVTSEAWGKDYYPAFNVAELGVMCRDCISGHCQNTGNPGKYYATPDEYAGYDIDSLIGDVTPYPDPLPCYCEAETQAIALADLLIWLLETKGITAEEVNQRLSAA